MFDKAFGFASCFFDHSSRTVNRVLHSAHALTITYLPLIIVSYIIIELLN